MSGVFRGVITRIDYRQKVFHLKRDVEDGKLNTLEFKLSSKLFVPAAYGDTMTVKYDEIKAKDGSTYLLVEESPTVIVNTSESIVVNIIKKRGEIEWKSAKSLYKSFEQSFIPTKNYTVYDKICQISYRYCVGGEHDIANEYISDITPEKFGLLMRNWHNKESPRRLWLLGLYSKDIVQSETDYYSLYCMIVANPFAVYSITMQKAENVCSVLGIKITKTMRILGGAGRFIYDKRQSYMPLSRVEKEVPGFLKEYQEQQKLEKKSYMLVVDDTRVYLEHIFNAEKIIASSYKKMLESKDEAIPTSLLSDTMASLDDDQKKALITALTKRVSIISGGAGTGKSMLIGKLNQVCSQLCKEVVIVCAFAGKAVSRLKEVVESEKCFTIHMVISRYQVENAKYRIIIDEASMVPMVLFAQLLEKFSSSDYSITLVGDTAQLPPIEAGKLLEESKKVLPICYLNQCHRVNQNSNLYKAMKDICFQTVPTLTFGDNFLHVNGGEENVVGLVQALYNKTIHRDHITVICPYVKDCISLNKKIQALHLEDKCPIYPFYTGDKVMMTTNDYDNDVMNGEEGHFLGLSPKGEWKFEFPDKNFISYSSTDEKKTIKKDDKKTKFREVILDDDSKKNVCLSYCITVHKSQGSEWKYVIVYIPEGRKPSRGFLNKRMLYTAISRGKNFVFIVDKNCIVNDIYKTMPGISYDYLASRCGVEDQHIPDEITADNDFDMEEYADMW